MNMWKVYTVKKYLGKCSRYYSYTTVKRFRSKAVLLKSINLKWQGHTFTHDTSINVNGIFFFAFSNVMIHIWMHSHTLAWYALQLPKHYTCYYFCMASLFLHHAICKLFSMSVFHRSVTQYCLLIILPAFFGKHKYEIIIVYLKFESLLHRRHDIVGLSTLKTVLVFLKKNITCHFFE